MSKHDCVANYRIKHFTPVDGAMGLRKTSVPGVEGDVYVTTQYTNNKLPAALEGLIVCQQSLKGWTPVHQLPDQGVNETVTGQTLGLGRLVKGQIADVTPLRDLDPDSTKVLKQSLTPWKAQAWIGSTRSQLVLWFNNVGTDVTLYPTKYMNEPAVRVGNPAPGEPESILISHDPEHPEKWKAVRIDEIPQGVDLLDPTPNFPTLTGDRLAVWQQSPALTGRQPDSQIDADEVFRLGEPTTGGAWVHRTELGRLPCDYPFVAGQARREDNTLHLTYFKSQTPLGPFPC